MKPLPTEHEMQELSIKWPEWIVKIVNWLTSIFTPEFQEMEYNGNKIKTNIDPLILVSITDGWNDQNVESITVIHHDRFKMEFKPEKWRIHGSHILKNCRRIRVRVIFK